MSDQFEIKALYEPPLPGPSLNVAMFTAHDEDGGEVNLLLTLDDVREIHAVTAVILAASMPGDQP